MRTGAAVAAVLAVLVVFPGAAAGAVEADRLVAGSQVRSWESRSFAGTMFVNIIRDGRRLDQHYFGNRGAEYRDGALTVRVRVMGRTPRFWLRVRYVSLGRPVPFTVRLARQPLG